jgi:hypothetical protein
VYIRNLFWSLWLADIHHHVPRQPALFVYKLDRSGPK